MNKKLTAGLFCIILAAMVHAAPGYKILMLGNSLTKHYMPPVCLNYYAQHAGIDTTDFLCCLSSGASTRALWLNGNLPSQTQWTTENHWIKDVPDAIHAKKYDILQVEPYLDGITTPAEEQTYADSFFNVVLGDNPNANLFVYEQMNRNIPDWAQPLFENVAKQVQDSHPGKRVTILPVKRVIDSLMTLAKAGQIPTLSTGEEFYEDNQHSTRLGAWVTTLVWLATYYRIDITNCANDTTGDCFSKYKGDDRDWIGYFPVYDPPLASEAGREIVRRVVWGIVNSYSWSRPSLTCVKPAANASTSYNSETIQQIGNGVQVKGVSGECRITGYDNAGRMVFSRNFDGAQPVVYAPLSRELANRSYIVRVTINGQTTVQRLLRCR